MAVGRKTGGRKKGTPNKATSQARDAIAIFVEKGTAQLWAWLEKVEDPAKRIELVARLAEFHVPRLARAELTGESGEAISIEIVRTVAAVEPKD